MAKPEVKVKNDAEGYMHDLSLILIALGKHLSVIDEIELAEMDKFTIAGLVMATGTQLCGLNDKLEDWGILKF